jgi:hypothetical protein
MIIQAEQGHSTVSLTIGLQSFKDRLAVVKYG